MLLIVKRSPHYSKRPHPRSPSLVRVSPAMATKILTRNQIRELIAQGNVIVIYKDYVLNLTSWMKFHPGGDKAVFHMVGRDATDEMHAYHSEATVSRFKKFSIGKIDYEWKNLLPPIQGAIYTVSSMRRGRSLEDKLDEALELSSDVSSESYESQDHLPLASYKKSGYPEGHVEPVLPQNLEYISDTNKEMLFPTKKSVIVDPKEVAQNHDNMLTMKDLAELPLLDYATQNAIRERYNKLHAEVIRRGLYQCEYIDYVRELVKIASLFLFAFLFLKIKWYFLSAVCIGMAWHQGTFIAHDAGHVSITHNYQFDNVFGILVADFFGGLSIGWWKRNHNVHHLITNDPVHDPDIQHLPFFAVSTRLFGDVYSTYYEKVLWFDAIARKTIPFQNYLYYPLLAFGRFNLYRLSWTHILLGQGPRHGPAAWFRYLEFVGLSWFFYWFFGLVVPQVDGGWNKFMYIMVSHITTMLVHVQITLSHFAMSTADLGVSESFPSRQLRTTMDVDCPEWLDFLHGGLQFQAIHHLFPRLPRHNLRRAQGIVLEFCQDVGLPYSIYGFGKGNEIVISKLAEIGKQCSIMLDCTRKMKEDNIDPLH